MRKLLTLFCFLSLSTVGHTQTEETEPNLIEQLQQRIQANEDAIGILQKLKISGYIQAQLQVGEKDASLKVGSANEDKDNTFSRVGIRRGRIKFSYGGNIISSVFQLDITEKGVGLKDAYLNVSDPWVGTNAIRMGIFDRPFGYEINHSSSLRESPERSTIFQTLFPDERDLGAMLVLQPSKTSPWNMLKLEAGLFSGNGIKPETDSRKDFIGHLSVTKNVGDNVKVGFGASYYMGGVYQTTQNIYELKDNVFVLNDDPANVGKYAKRQYVGFDANFSILTAAGMTTFRGEYLFGQQPGSSSSTKSPNYSLLPGSSSSAPAAYDTYIRKFNGGYLVFIQDMGTLPLSAVVKYDWYDPNSKVSGDNIGSIAVGSEKASSKTDLLQNTVGLGLLWRVNPALRITAYYEINRWESSKNITDYDGWKANVFTLRLQHKF